jgi:uncharacterized membrane protein YciS (DUF1049 family)
MLLSLILLVIMTVLASYFATNNLDIIQVNLLGYPIHGTTGTLMVAALGIGVLLGVIVMLPAYISRSWSLIRHRRKVQDLQDRQGKPPYSVPEESEED